MKSKKSIELAELLPSSKVHNKQLGWYDQLLPEQRKAADFVIDKIRNGGGVGLFSQMRTGKTYISLAVIEQLKLKNVLIVAPLTSLDIVWVPRLATLGEVLRNPSGAPRGLQNAFLVYNYQAFVKIAPRLAQLPWDLVIIDESQGLKARATAQSRAARRLRHSKRRLALSGTPIDECPTDVWAQMRFIDHTVLGEDWLPFAEEFCYKGGYMGKKWIFNKHKMDKFLSVINPHIYRLTVGFMGLKPIKLFPVPVQLLGSQDEIYQQMQNHGIVQLNGHTITGPLEITKKVKLQQITGGSLLTEDGDVIPVGQAKQRKLSWLINRLDPPVVVFCQYLHEIKDIKNILMKRWPRVVTLYGGIKDTEKIKYRTDLINDFQAGRYDAIVCQLRTGGVSIELTRASSLVLYSINYSFIDFEQIIFRLRGLSQQREVRVYLLYVEKTVDEEKLNIVEAKKSIVWTVMSSFER